MHPKNTKVRDFVLYCLVFFYFLRRGLWRGRGSSIIEEKLQQSRYYIVIINFIQKIII